MIAKLKNISKTYGKKQVLADFSLTLAAGEIVCLLGANGAGKSTLIKIVAGLLEPDQESEVEILGKDAKYVNLREDIVGFRSWTRLLSQDDVLIPELTVRQHLEMACMIRGIRNISETI